MTYRYSAGSVACAALLILTGCPDDPPPRRAPPPPEAKPATCSGERKVNDPSNLVMFPETTGEYCIDPNASDQGFGDGAKNPLDGICDLFDGECEIYKRFDVKRVIEARYVDGAGSGQTIDIKLSQFSSSENAYAMFTKRVVGDQDPAHPDAMKPIEGGGAAALGWGNAYLWRGSHLAEIVFSAGPDANDKEIKAAADKLLPPLVKDFGAKISGDSELPPAAAALPEDKRLPLGIRFANKELLGVKGTGSGAYGYYKDGDARWRVLSIVKGDEDEAKDVVKTFRAISGATDEKGIGNKAVRVMVKHGGPETEWLIAQKGNRVVGIGDEVRVLREGMSPDEHRKKTLSQDAKRDVLKTLVTASAK